MQPSVDCSVYFYYLLNEYLKNAIKENVDFRALIERETNLEIEFDTHNNFLRKSGIENPVSVDIKSASEFVTKLDVSSINPAEPG